MCMKNCTGGAFMEKLKLFWSEYGGFLRWMLFDLIFIIIFILIGYHKGYNAAITETQNTSSLKNQIVITRPLSHLKE